MKNSNDPFPSTRAEREAWCRHYLWSQVFAPSQHCDSIGVELELLPRIISANDTYRCVPLNSDEQSLVPLLMKQVARAAQPVFCAPNDLYALKFYSGDALFFEPGGQLEFSSSPCNSLNELYAKLKWWDCALKELEQNTDISFLGLGCEPQLKVDEVGLQLPRQRYRSMKRYFDAIGDFGREMMLLTCSIQVNMDYGITEQQMVDRVVAAHLLNPILTAIFANSPSANSMASRRMYIWSNTDPLRTADWLSEAELTNCSREVLVNAYARFAMAAPLIYVEGLEQASLTQEHTWQSWMEKDVEGIAPNGEAFKQHLTRLFPMVRPKGFIEFRSIDALPAQWWSAPALIVHALLHRDEALKKVLALLLPQVMHLAHFREQAIYGLRDDLLFNAACNVMQLALDQLKAYNSETSAAVVSNVLRDFAEQFTFQRRTPAHEAHAAVSSLFSSKSNHY